MNSVRFTYCHFYIVYSDSGTLMATVSPPSLYCPSQKTSVISVAGTADLSAVINGPGYQSLYAKNRKDLDKLPVRRETFVFYPSWSPVDRNLLAAAGFYYTGEDDTVACFSCGLSVTSWKQEDIPINVHKAKSPNCQFIMTTISHSLPSQQCVDSDNDSSEDSDNDECTDGIQSTEQEMVDRPRLPLDSEDDTDGSFVSPSHTQSKHLSSAKERKQHSGGIGN